MPTLVRDFESAEAKAALRRSFPVEDAEFALFFKLLVDVVPSRDVTVLDAAKSKAWAVPRFDPASINIADFLFDLKLVVEQHISVGACRHADELYRVYLNAFGTQREWVRKFLSVFDGDAVNMIYISLLTWYRRDSSTRALTDLQNLQFTSPERVEEFITAFDSLNAKVTDVFMTPMGRALSFVGKIPFELRSRGELDTKTANGMSVVALQYELRRLCQTATVPPPNAMSPQFTLHTQISPGLFQPANPPAFGVTPHQPAQQQFPPQQFAQQQFVPQQFVQQQQPTPMELDALSGGGRGGNAFCGRGDNSFRGPRDNNFRGRGRGMAVGRYGRGRGVVCYNCGGTGHVQFQCPTPGPNV